jgi:hypothetical protein
MHESHWQGVSRHYADDKDGGDPRTGGDARCRAGH